MNIVVVGAGGVGGNLGMRLVEAGHEVSWLARGQRLAALRERGISLSSPFGDVRLGPQRAGDDAAALGPADAVIVTVKLYDLEAVAPRLRPLLKSGTAVLPLQNGVEAHAILGRTLGPGAVLKGTVSIKASLAGDAVICKSGFCRLRLAEADGRISDRVQQLGEALKCGKGVEPTLSPTIELELWRKFAMLASFSAVSCLARATIGQVLDSREARSLVLDLTEEAAAVGRARGVELPAGIAEASIDAVARELPRDGKPSMLEDLEAGRKLELPWLSGGVVRLGREAGVPTPLHTSAYRALALHAAGRS